MQATNKKKKKREIIFWYFFIGDIDQKGFFKIIIFFFFFVFISFFLVHNNFLLLRGVVVLADSICFFIRIKESRNLVIDYYFSFLYIIINFLLCYQEVLYKLRDNNEAKTNLSNSTI